MIATGVVPTMDVGETASSNASCEDLAVFDESTKRDKGLDGFYPSHDTVQSLLLLLLCLHAMLAQ